MCAEERFQERDRDATEVGKTERTTRGVDGVRSHATYKHGYHVARVGNATSVPLALYHTQLLSLAGAPDCNFESQRVWNLAQKILLEVSPRPPLRALVDFVLCTACQEPTTIRA